MTNLILKGEGICKAYGDQQVLSNLDITIESGKIYGLIGRNGTGKTTLLSILTAQNTHDSGAVTLNGEQVWENQGALDNLCFSRELQSTTLGGPNNLTVKYYLTAASIFYPHWDKEYAKKLLEEFKLPLKKKISQLSKGQMSLITILIALASRAPITILDEPVAGLDVVMRERFYAMLLEDYTQTGRTFVVSTHILEEAKNLFEDILILDQGRLIEACPTEELLEQFRTVSGSVGAVDRVCMGVEVLRENVIGGHKSAVVRSSPVKLTALDADPNVTVAPVDLQGVFVALCGHSEV